MSLTRCPTSESQGPYVGKLKAQSSSIHSEATHTNGEPNTTPGWCGGLWPHLANLTRTTHRLPLPVCPTSYHPTSHAHDSLELVVHVPIVSRRTSNSGTVSNDACFGCRTHKKETCRGVDIRSFKEGSNIGYVCFGSCRQTSTNIFLIAQWSSAPKRASNSAIVSSDP